MSNDANSPRLVYLDHHATTPLDPRVLTAMMPFLTDQYANPSSAHHFGRQAQRCLREARKSVQHALAASHESEIIFTSGATEANTLAIIGAVAGRQWPDEGHIVTTAIEHHSVHAACDQLKKQGYSVTTVGVDSEGLVHPEDIAAVMTPHITVVSVMLANNEIGTIQPIASLADVVTRHGALFHVDAVQGAGALPLNVDELGVDLLTISAHKIYGPKGVGALYVRRGTQIHAQFSGTQEYGLRAGTTNLAGIVGLATALRIAIEERTLEAHRVSGLRNKLEHGLLAAIPDARLNGSARHRLPGNLSLTIPGIDATDVIQALPDIALSAGSACTTGTSKPSHVLSAIGLSPSEARATVRIGVGRWTSERDVDLAKRRIAEVVSELR
ncbi:cysteine desulfurase [Micromonospora noduli]|uniref:cysteine desulfurase family protein n=1 Tax=Micromonospora noduli TaxID=709876 RepID=UPI00124B89C4|nr:cysteine desulfurase family protein [Micromonospora noduli]KAB1925823.1 cysteine desulfurase [Micromonospora noduli]